MLKLQVIVVSTRPGRAGLPIARWFHEVAARAALFDVELVDLAEANLPLLDEPHHPRLRKYEHEHTRAWSARVAAADAFVFVTPEYNYGVPPTLVNALDYLYHEWNYKPAAFVNYGGVSGGTRAAQMARSLLVALRVMPLPDAVTIPFFANHLDREAGRFNGTEALEKSAHDVLAELLRWAEALAPMRAPRPAAAG